MGINEHSRHFSGVHKELLHAGPESTVSVLRQQICLTKGRREVKRVLRKCVFRHRQRVGHGAITVGAGVIISSLHSRRNRPLFVRENPISTKAYICTFTYACSRMTHLKLTSDLSTNEFFQALIRMISGRLLSSTIWSDNTKSADSEIQQLFTQVSSAGTK